MGWAEERARLLADDSPEIEAATVEAVPYPLPVKRGRQYGDIAVQDPETGEWVEMAWEDATPVWQAALRRKRGAD